MVDQSTNERTLCGQWAGQNFMKEFHLGFYAMDSGASCQTTIPKAILFYANPIQFVNMNSKTAFDGKLAKIEIKEKVDEILQHHSLLKQKKKRVQTAKVGSQAILKSVLEGIQNYEGLFQKRVQEESQKIDMVLSQIKKEAFIMEQLSKQFQNMSEEGDKDID